MNPPSQNSLAFLTGLEYKTFMDDKTLQALEEAIQALGSIPADQFTEQQKLAYRLCVQVMVDHGYLENYDNPLLSG